MSYKVFRLHEGADGTGWFNSDWPDAGMLNSIRTDAKDVATSIPSPYAFIDLIKTAFKWVAEGDINGNTAYHKLVSYTLDVAQLFFNARKLQKKVKIAAWNPIDGFNRLERGNERHKRLAKTLKLFWNQDAPVFNFDRVDRLYFILSSTNDVLGATSPATLFLPAPDASNIADKMNIQIGLHKVFADDFLPLNERDDEFIFYMYILQKQPNFAFFFPEFNEYLEKVKNYLSTEFLEKIAGIEVSDINNYEDLTVFNEPGLPCEFMGIKLKIRNEDPAQIETDSDFVIRSDYDINDLGLEYLPLILPNKKFSEKWIYTTKGILWDENNEVPDKNNNEPNESFLPVYDDRYYWLSIGNFLEDYIIKLPHFIDENKFLFYGFLSFAEKKYNYLIPLTSTFFKFFKPERVQDYLKIKELASGNVEVELKIPVKGGFIEFRKTYTREYIKELDINLAIFPFLKSDYITVDYKIGLLDARNDRVEDIYIQLYNREREVNVSEPIERNPGEVLDEQRQPKTLYYKSSEKFDKIRLNVGKARGFIIPNFPEVGNGAENIIFAIDFGTSNTHIEYKKSGLAPTSFKNLSEEPLWQYLYKDENYKVFESEIMPYVISPDAQINFPVRTAIVYNKNLDFNRNIEIIRQINNFFLFGHSQVPNYLNLKTELKWKQFADIQNSENVESYIEFLLIMVYYKSLLLGANPATTTVVWFYPASMDEAERSNFEAIWNDKFEQIFGSDAKIQVMPESIPPYLYFRPYIAGLTLSIDIGGGTSDFAVFDAAETNAQFISSIKFAGNAIFGDGYPSDNYHIDTDNNGFVRAFVDEVKKALADDETKLKILEHILYEAKNTTDFINFLFSLEAQGIYEFSRRLREHPTLKFSIFFFYAALAYYAANLLKRSEIDIPKNIVFSGSASKTAKILDPSEDMTQISHLFSFFFEKVYKKEVEHTIKIKLPKNPKIITCKGALSAELEEIGRVPIKFWMGGADESDSIWGAVLDRNNITEFPKYQELNNKINTQKIINAVEDFLNILEEYKGYIKPNLGIDIKAYETFKDLIKERNFVDDIMKGKQAFYKKNEREIEESIFFYPLISILNDLPMRLIKK